MKPQTIFSGLLIIVSLAQCQGQRSIFDEDYQSGGPTLSPQQEVEQIREIARAIRQVDNPTDLSVQNLLVWLQDKYNARATNTRRARQQEPSREYLPAAGSESNTITGSRPVDRPRPFQPPQQRPQQQQQQNRPRPTQKPTLRPSGPYPQPSDQPNNEPYPAPGPAPTPGFTTPPRTSTGYTYGTSTQGPVTQRPRPKPTTSSRPVYGVTSTTQGYDEDESGENAVEDGGAAAEEQERPTSGGGQVEEDIDENADGSDKNEDEKHPPHIHSIDVQCAKDMMTITIEFNRVFNGVIYSKGFYNSDRCRYVAPDSNQVKYTFTVSLDSCGTQFIDQFAQGGQAYLENVLVLQNEAGIQEVWDTVRTVRCLWEGSIKQDLSVSLTIGMLNQEIVTFNGDTGMARLDIQVGKGPFAQPANGLVKIGETMTLVVYVEGDSGFDVVVRSCQARDSDSENTIQLFDDRGCVLKPKLFGAFQKTTETGNTGASLIAYAYFSAFKFPDVMDLIIECNVELCKTDCEMCPDPQVYEPGARRRRDVNNTTLSDGKVLSGRMRVYSPEDIIDLTVKEHLVTVGIGHDGICMSTQGFLLSSFLVLSLLVCSCFTSAALWVKIQKNTIENKL